MSVEKIVTSLHLLGVPGEFSKVAATQKSKEDHAGNTKMNVLPCPGLLSAHTLPPCDVMISLTRAKPSPVPFTGCDPLGVTCRYLSKMLDRFSAGIPGPVS